MSKNQSMFRAIIFSITIFFVALNMSQLSAVGNTLESDSFSSISERLLQQNQARIYFHRSGAYVKPKVMLSQAKSPFKTGFISHPNPAQMKYNIMKIVDESTLAPFAQIRSTTKSHVNKVIKSVYVDTPVEKLALLVQILNTANFGTRQGFVDEIKLDLKAGNIYHVAVGIEGFRGTLTFSGMEEISLSQNLFNQCSSLKEEKLKGNRLKKAISTLTNVYGEILACTGLITSAEQLEFKKSFVKWNKKHQKGMLASLERRRASDLKRETGIEHNVENNDSD